MGIGVTVGTPEGCAVGIRLGNGVGELLGLIGAVKIPAPMRFERVHTEELAAS